MKQSGIWLCLALSLLLHLALFIAPGWQLSDESEEPMLLEAHLAARGCGPEIVISDERAELLETGGGLKKAHALLGDDPVFVANIDSVWIDRGDALADLVRLWNPETMDAVLLLARREGSPQCPECGAPMRKRTAKSGKNQGKPFWGCSGYPKCNGVREVEK